ncbi:putative nicotinate-nucleotide adenylyltransferase [Ciceribacter naphthalenivorans]|uniref:Probable nicotinate-nucleotide adenylyltransferase n=2 Tax=Alphaproteobacteria TaxID=28211 RepID=A0A512HK27_9HYPH|nr:putative nicotinate-nucleotide adenylyltransferase [Ciceribacter naphthalenivorans]GLR21662.1 putative nicotinate-nucleotide adenylyltransferase [Ciceribacter naphthalenivorans]GLT04518.1 putative nicotinate-nucleotide adenylyltransferase [Sphingomonas psychrolutea]
MEGEAIAQRYRQMPHVEPGMVVGLFGGSFNPPHQGHALVAEIALRRLGLDQLWWIVTPGNPLKSHGNLAPLGERLKKCEALAEDPRIKVTAFEQTLGTSYTAKTLDYVKARNRNARFIWVMGADNLASFHRWQRWQHIATTFPIAVIDRPGSTLAYLSSKMARTFDYARIDEDDAGVLWKKKAPAWTFIHGPRSTLSSTALREAATK